MIRMNEKRFQWNERIEGRIVEEFVVDNLTKKELDEEDMYELLNDLSDENKQLKQFQEQVASVIEGKMGDNVCNDYKIEVLKEIWNELELDEVWFE